MGNLLQPMPFKRLDQVGGDLGYQKAGVPPRLSSSSLEPHLDVGPHSYFLTVIYEFSFNEEKTLKYSIQNYLGVI